MVKVIEWYEQVQLNEQFNQSLDQLGYQGHMIDDLAQLVS